MIVNAARDHTGAEQFNKQFNSLRHTSLGLAGYESCGTPVHYTVTACHPAPTRRRMGPFSYKWFCSRIRDRTGTSKAASRTTVSNPAIAFAEYGVFD